MTCSKCKQKELPNTEYAGLKYCKTHFFELIEKRIRKEIRKEELNLKKKYYLLKSETPEYYLAKHFIKKIFNEHLKLEETEKIKPNTILPTNLDVEAKQFLEQYFQNTNLKTNGIKILKSITKEEISKLADILNINGTPKIGSEFLDNIESKYQGSKFSVMKSIENLRK